MSIIDIILGGLILFGLIRGLMKGLFVEIASLVALIAGVYGAIHFSNFAAFFFKNNVTWDEKYINVAAFAVTFIVIVIAISLAGKLLTKIANFAALGIINKVLGAAFGAAKFALILSVLLMIFDKFNNTIPFASEEELNKSIIYNPVKSLAPTVFPMIMDMSKIDADIVDEYTQ